MLLGSWSTPLRDVVVDVTCRVGSSRGAERGRGWDGKEGLATGCVVGSASVRLARQSGRTARRERRAGGRCEDARDGLVSAIGGRCAAAGGARVFRHVTFSRCRHDPTFHRAGARRSGAGATAAFPLAPDCICELVSPARLFGVRLSLSLVPHRDPRRDGFHRAGGWMPGRMQGAARRPVMGADGASTGRRGTTAKPRRVRLPTSRRGPGRAGCRRPVGPGGPG